MVLAGPRLAMIRLEKIKISAWMAPLQEAGEHPVFLRVCEIYFKSVSHLSSKKLLFTNIDNYELLHVVFKTDFHFGGNSADG